MPRPARALPLALCAAFAAAPTVAHGQTDRQKQKAKEHYEHATRHYDVGKYAEAIDEYQKAYLIVEDPAMLFNIAQAYRLWNKPEEALRSYRNYLRRSPGAANRADVESKIADLEKLIKDRKQGAMAPPVPPPVVPSPAPAPPPAAPVPAPAVTPEPTVAPPAAPPPAAEVRQEPAVQRPSMSGTRRVAVSFLIGGGVLLATSFIAGGIAADKAKELGTAANGGLNFDPKIEKDGKAANAVAIVTGLVGLAAGVTGGILFIASRPANPTTASASAAPTSARPRLSLHGLLAPGFAGAGARLVF